MNMFILMNIYFLLLKLCENERRHSILISKFEKSILFSTLFILCTLEQVFQMAHRKIVIHVVFVLAHPAFIIVKVVYDHDGLDVGSGVKSVIRSGPKWQFFYSRVNILNKMLHPFVISSLCTLNIGSLAFINVMNRVYVLVTPLPKEFWAQLRNIAHDSNFVCRP